MAIHQHATLNDTLYFWFGSNDTSGSGDDGASPACDVRLAGATITDAPILSPTPALISHVNYSAGCYEVAVAATSGNGFAATNTYAVFCTLTVDSQNPTGFFGSFTLDPIIANVKEISDDSAAADNLELALENATAGYVASDMKYLDGGLQSATDLKDFADAGYDPATNSVEIVKLVDVTTTNSDMVSEPPTAAAVVNEWETQSQADPTGFHVNVKEVDGTAQTANDNGADINTLVTEVGKVPKSDGSSSWNATALAALKSEANDALVALNLDHLLKVVTAAADMTTEVVDNTVMSRILANGDTSAFTPSTDGLQPIRDRGDVDWVTAPNDPSANTIRDAILDDATRFSGADIASILTDTNELQGDWANGGRLDLLIDSIITAVVGTISEITGASDIPTTPTIKQAIMLRYMLDRNDTQTTSSERRVLNNAGSEVLDATMSDDATTFSSGKLGAA